MPSPAPENPLPPRPRAVLRLGFAGRRELQPDSEAHLRRALGSVLVAVGHRLAALTPGVPVEAGMEPPAGAFFDRRPPLLRLVTGLCEGADTVAAELLEGLTIAPDGAPDGAQAGAARAPCLDTELAAVLPFDLPDYRASRPPAFRAEFDRQAQRCAYILALDGIYAKPDPDTPLAAARRAKAYRAQSALLLRHADILIAAADPNEAGKAGGTLETVGAGLAFGLPVIFIHTGSGAVWPIAPGEDLADALSEPPPAPAELDRRLADLVSWVLADPALGINRTPGGPRQDPGLTLLQEYFGNAGQPPSKPGRNGRPERKPTVRERVWTWAERGFRTGPKPMADARLPPYTGYRDRATSLNYHYSGLYRGAYALNYVLAVVAVALATLALVLIGIAGAHPAPVWLNPTLLGLGAAKLGILAFIARNTFKTNREGWIDQAVDYRYLAERLRTLFYLPRAGSFQPPAAARPYHAVRAERQSAVDWLFESILRSVSPAELAREETFPSDDGPGPLRVQVLRPNQGETLALIRDPWVAGQVAYHARNTATQESMDRFAERTAARLSYAVVAVVAADLLILLLDMVIQVPAIDHALPHPIAHGLHGLAHRLHGYSPWLLWLAAVLPAAMASLNGLRFQGESRRLAERSGVLRVVLGGRAQEAEALSRRIAEARTDPAKDPGAWSLDTLRLAERIADDCVREVAEWSVLYAKELPET